jgi:hypothetical protein
MHPLKQAGLEKQVLEEDYLPISFPPAVPGYKLLLTKNTKNRPLMRLPAKDTIVNGESHILNVLLANFDNNTRQLMLKTVTYCSLKK